MAVDPEVLEIGTKVRRGRETGVVTDPAGCDNYAGGCAHRARGGHANCISVCRDKTDRDQRADWMRAEFWGADTMEVITDAAPAV